MDETKKTMTTAELLQKLDLTADVLVRPKLEINRVSDLKGKRIELPPVLIEGLLREREVMVMAGESKVGKTWLGFSMAHAVATGTPWLGMSIPNPGAVLYLNFEIDGSVANQRMQKICEALDGQFPTNLLMSHLRGDRADIPKLRDILIEAKKEHDLKLIIIDALYNALGDRDENSNGDMAALMAEFTDLTMKAGCAVDVIHHFNKSSHGGGDGRAGATKMSGAGALHRSPECILTFSRLKDDEVESLGLDAEDSLHLKVEASLRTFREMMPFVIGKKHDEVIFGRVDVDLREARKKSKGGRPKGITLDDLTDWMGDRSLSPTELKAGFMDDMECGGTTVDKLMKEGREAGRLVKDAEGKLTVVKKPEFPTPLASYVVPPVPKRVLEVLKTDSEDDSRKYTETPIVPRV